MFGIGFCKPVVFMDWTQELAWASHGLKRKKLMNMVRKLVWNWCNLPAYVIADRIWGNKGVPKLFGKVGQKLQYQVNLVTSRRPGLWGPQLQLLGAAFGAGVCSCSGPRHLQGTGSSWT
ncbi:hypothetical protein V6N12_024069 [Hibiscus sabdariffa]|uniref:Uncharacterized protein n=1 Tax=Hibiscus sabdariffa TaxID=183260 RepID=A0ABR2FZG5_9ROSI